MALQGTNQNQSSQMGDAMQSAQARAQQQQDQQQTYGRPAGQPISLLELGRLNRIPMSRSPGSEVMEKLRELLNNEYADIPHFNTKVIAIDGPSSGLPYSVLVVAVQDKQDTSKKIASFHSLLIASSAEDPSPRMESIGNRQYEVIRVPGDAFEPGVIKVLTEIVSRDLGTDLALVNAGGCVVPRDFNLQDQALVRQLAANAVYAAAMELDMRSDTFVNINLANTKKDAALSTRINWNNPQGFDAVGNPVRRDITVDLLASAMQQSQSITAAAPIHLTHAEAYMDLIYVGPDEAAAQAARFGQPNPNAFRLYAPRAVITGLDCLVPSTAGMLLALITMTSIRENGQFYQYFRRRHYGQGMDLHDIGAVGYEVKLEGKSERIETDTEFDDPELGALLNMILYPKVVFSLDVPEAGPNTWMLDVFSAASENRQEAMDHIRREADILTGGIFSQVYQGSGRFAFDEENRIHLGTFSDNGVKSDGRVFDYLAWLNLAGERDLGKVSEWSDTFDRTEYPLVQRLGERYKLLTSAAPDFKVTGFAKRVTFEHEFIEALVKAALQVGLDVRQTGPIGDFRGQTRATSQYFSQTGLGLQASGLFNRGGYVGSQQTSGGYRSSSTRW